MKSFLPLVCLFLVACNSSTNPPTTTREKVNMIVALKKQRGEIGVRQAKQIEKVEAEGKEYYESPELLKMEDSIRRISKMIDSLQAKAVK